MAIKNPEQVVAHIVEWLRTRVLAAGAKTAVVGVSGGADSALVAILCQRAFPDTLAVLMPCHSSRWSTDRGIELCNKFRLRYVAITLDRVHEQIANEFRAQFEIRNVAYEPSQLAMGSLRSCLRSPTLDYAAKLVNGLIIGTGNRDEDGIVRYFNKRGDGAVDLSPIADLHKSEVFELLRYLNAPKAIIEAAPSADLWGPDAGQTDEGEMGVTYDEVEWADRENVKHGVLTGAASGLEAHGLDMRFGYSERQIEVILRVRHLERVSRHKASLPPVCEVRHLTGAIE